MRAIRRSSAPAALGLFRNRINELEKKSLEELVNIGEKSASDALLILKSKILRDRLGKYRPDSLFNIQEYNQNEIDPVTQALYTGTYILSFAKAHKAVHQYVADHLSGYVSPDHLKQLNYDRGISPRQ